MTHFFNDDYLMCNNFTLSMIVTNGVLRDSRVLKTADSLNKRGFRVHLFGLNKNPWQEDVEGYPFKITLVSSPARPMKKEGVWYISEGKQNLGLFYERLALSYLEAFNNNEYDFLHTHDMWGLSIGAKLKDWGVSGKKGWVHDIHEYVQGCSHIPEDKQSFHLSMEKSLIKEPDVLTCVTPGMSQLLSEDYNITPPKVVMNIPRCADFDPHYPKPIRHVLGLNDKTPLMVYSGSVKPARGIHLAVKALPLLPGVHLALITENKGSYIEELSEIAKQLGVSSRFHILPYVSYNDVTSFLNGANLGIRPSIRYGNSELGLPTKLFEYLHAGLPVISSNSTGVTNFINEYNCGAVHPFEDVEGFAHAVDNTLSLFPEGLSNAAEGSAIVKLFCWEEQEKIIYAIYNDLLPDNKQNMNLKPLSSIQPILHLPRHSANQPGTLAQTLRAQKCEANCAAYGKNRFGYKEDIEIKKQKNALSSIKEYSKQGLDKYNTFHFHAAPLLYKSDYYFPAGLDLVLFKAMGKRVFFHFRGSEIRLHSVYMDISPYHFVDDYLDNNNNYQLRVDGLPYFFSEEDQRNFRDYVQGVCDSVFVTDPELQCYVPGSIIVPRGIDIKKTVAVGIVKKQIPLIIHAPSRDLLKGTHFIKKAVEGLREEGYRFEFVLVENFTHEEAMEIYSKADIIIDQLRIGWYGVLAVEGMALGKAVVSYVANHLRHYLPTPAPLVYANPDNITEVLRYLLENPEEVARYGERGRKFVEEYHDANKIAKTLLKIYRRPIRPAEPVATANFIEYQMKKAKAFEKEKRKKIINKSKEKKTITKKIKTKAKKLVKITRKKGPFVAAKKTAGFIKKKLL